MLATGTSCLARVNVIGRSRVTEILDRGDKGAFMYSERDVIDQASGALLCTLTSTTVLRGEGGADRLYGWDDGDELDQIYEKLGSQLGTRQERKEVASSFAGSLSRRRGRGSSATKRSFSSR